MTRNLLALGLLLVLGLAACTRGARPGSTVTLWAPDPNRTHPLGPGQQLEVVAEYPRPVSAGKVFFYVAWQGPGGTGRMPLRALDTDPTQRGVGRWPPPDQPLPPGDYQLWAVAYDDRGEYASARAPVVILPAFVSPSPSPQPTPTPTQRPAPARDAPRQPRATGTPTTGVCYRAAFVTDVTVPDGSPVVVGEPFVKVWRLRNAGACVWGPGTRVVLEEDDGLAAPADWLLPAAPVLPGETVDVQVTLQATGPGPHAAAFRLLAVDGTRFGIGPADGPFWVQVEALTPTPTATATATAAASP